jgi:UDP-N-acetylglucosamine 2-epimerase (non-hydrolysing)
MKMPEEINRILTDRISSLLFVTEQSGLENLKKEGFEQDKIFFTGNVMIDSLMFYLNKIDASSILKQHKLDDASYVLATFHRPSNVDSEDALKRIVETVNFLAEHKKVVFPIHPRTRNNLERFDLLPAVHERVLLLEPLGYLDFLKLIKHATLVVTDSGGIQEETTYLGVPCVTVRESTERPVTCELGTNILAGTDFGKVRSESEKILNGNVKKGEIPPLWDGKASRRIVEIIKNYLS